MRDIVTSADTQVQVRVPERSVYRNISTTELSGYIESLSSMGVPPECHNRYLGHLSDTHVSLSTLNKFSLENDLARYLSQRQLKEGLEAVVTSVVLSAVTYGLVQGLDSSLLQGAYRFPMFVVIDPVAARSAFKAMRDLGRSFANLVISYLPPEDIDFD